MFVWISRFLSGSRRVFCSTKCMRRGAKTGMECSKEGDGINRDVVDFCKHLFYWCLVQCLPKSRSSSWSFNKPHAMVSSVPMATTSPPSSSLGYIGSTLFLTKFDAKQAAKNTPWASSTFSTGSGAYFKEDSWMLSRDCCRRAFTSRSNCDSSDSTKFRFMVFVV